MHVVAAELRLQPFAISTAVVMGPGARFAWPGRREKSSRACPKTLTILQRSPAYCWRTCTRRMLRKGPRMATSESIAIADHKQSVIPAALFNACFALLVINVCYFPVAYVSGMWIWEANGL